MGDDRAHGLGRVAVAPVGRRERCTRPRPRWRRGSRRRRRRPAAPVARSSTPIWVQPGWSSRDRPSISRTSATADSERVGGLPRLVAGDLGVGAVGADDLGVARLEPAEREALGGEELHPRHARTRLGAGVGAERRHRRWGRLPRWPTRSPRSPTCRSTGASRSPPAPTPGTPPRCRRPTCPRSGSPTARTARAGSASTRPRRRCASRSGPASPPPGTSSWPRTWAAPWRPRHGPRTPAWCSRRR